jgi:hypothetical protein
LLLVELGAQIEAAQLLAVPRVGQELRDTVAGEKQPGVLPARRVLADHFDHAAAGITAHGRRWRGAAPR